MTAYLDHAATTTVRAAALDAFVETAALTGNPSSVHAAGRRTRAIVEESREQVAAVLDAHPQEVVFTSGGTEADNLALRGLYAVRQAPLPRPGVVVGAIEHPAVLDAAEHLGSRGAQVRLAAADRQGVVQVDAVLAAVAEAPDQVAVTALMWANNELGTLQPVVQVASRLAEHGIPLHTDAVQAVGQVPISFRESGAATMALTGHKLGAPVGTGALLVRRDVSLEPLLHGGGQERGLRSGTLNAAGARAFAVALAEADVQREQEARRRRVLRDRVLQTITAAAPGISTVVPWPDPDGTALLPGHAHVLIDGCDGEALLFLLDAAGIAVSAGSACAAGVTRPSHVLAALGMTDDEPRAALRISLGHSTSDADVDALLAALPGAVERARAAQAVR